MTPPSEQADTLAPGRPPRAKAAETTLLYGLFQRLPIVLALNLAAALGTVLVFAGRRPTTVLAAWFLFMLLTLALRLWIWRAQRRAAPAAAPAPAWAYRFTFGAAATGLAWGLAGVIFYAPDSWIAQIFLPFIMAGMVGGSVTALTGYMPAYLAFSTCTLMPYALRLAAEGDGPHLVMAGLVVLYLLGMGLLARTVNASMVAAVRLAAENEDLVAALREKSAQLEATFDTVNQGVAVFDQQGRLATWNPRHRELHGYPAELYRRGVDIGEFLRHDGRRVVAGDGAAPRDAPQGGPRRAAPARFEQPGAAGRMLEVERNPMPGGGFVSTSTDITERKRTEARMLHLAQHDALTGLPNRLLFNDRLQQAMTRCRRSGSVMAMLLLDLDNFKQVNDALGHPIGDRVLQQTGERLRAALRASDTVARIGGDEFALILQELPVAGAATTIADKLVSQLGQPFELDGHVWRLRASLGIALFPRDGASAEQLMQNADRAMYRAKAAGGGFALAAGEIRHGGQRHGLEHDLGRAIERGQLTLEYQPQVDLPSARVSGIEALLRWRHPEHGAIAPESLIRLAETSGQIGAIGEWALREACAAATRWPPGLPPVRIAVNLAASQLVSDDFVALVRRTLDATGLPAERLELELTETSMLNEIDRVTTTLAALREMGVSVALDDFGTGYASLSHLRQFPLDALKIDRSFVAALAPAPEAAAAAIVQSLIELGHRLGMRVIAEGVEDQAQLATLRRLGCDAVQGHAVGHPLTTAEIGRWLVERLGREGERQP